MNFPKLLRTHPVAASGAEGAINVFIIKRVYTSMRYFKRDEGT